MSKTLGRPVGNKYRVNKKQWAKWNEAARREFNRLYELLASHKQWMFIHMDAPPLPRKHWTVIRWNVAFLAACGVNDE